MKNLTFLFLILPFFQFGQKNINLENSEELLRKGYDHYQKEEYYEAIRDYNKVSINDTNYAKSQYEMALSYIGMEQYIRAQEILHDLLDYKIRFDFKHQVYSLLGNAYNKNKQPEEAIKVYSEGIKLYPHQHLLYYNRGVCYENQKKYAEAIADYQASIKGNVYYYPSHLRLGIIAANQGLYDQALMSLLMFTWIEPEDSRVNEVVGIMESLANGSFESTHEQIKVFENGDPYSEFNELFTNKIALQDNYKTKFTIGTDYAKQLHLFLKNNTYNKDNLDFWNQIYMPFYQSVWENKKLDELILVSLIPNESDAIQGKIKGKISKIRAFYDWSKTEFDKLASTQYMEFEGKEQFIYANYAAKGLISLGHLGGPDGRTEVGNNYYYHPNGLLKMIAHLDEKGDPIGTWEIFNEFDGNISRKVEFVDATTKKFYEYYFTGELNEKYTLKNNLAQDTVYIYFKNGTLKEKYPMKDGKKNGLYTAYYRNGSIYYQVNYVDGKGEGAYTEYHPNGEIQEQFTLKDDMIQGVRSTFYENKQLRTEYNYEADLYNGTFQRFYPNGQLEEKGAYKKGKQIGLSEEYFSNGKLSISMTLDESGKQNGKSTFYDLDGKKYHEFEFSKGELTEIVFIDKNNKATVLATKKGKKLDFIRNHPNGERDMIGQKIDGLNEGEWNYYDVYGNLWKREYYSKGELKDSLITYHPNGQRNRVFQIKDGQKNGLFLEYNIFGDLIREGFYTDNEIDKDWISYRFDGTFESQNYYVNGTQHGIQKDFAVNGKLNTFQELDMGREITNIYLDTNERIIDEFPEYNGEITLHSPDNSYVRLVAHYKNGNADGVFTWYGPNKQVTCAGAYLNDERTGTWKWFSLTGKLIHEVNYVNGERDGLEVYYAENGTKTSDLIWVKGVSEGVFHYYHDNGKVSLTGSYFNDERHGKVTTFNANGEVMMIRYYNQGVIESYAYMGTDGKEIAPIKLDSKEMSITCYYKNGKKSTEHQRKNGLIEGKYTEYYENGTKSEENTYLHDEENGKFYQYNENGAKIEETDYVKGLKHGWEITYFSNGKIKSKTPYLYGDKHGTALVYNADGKITQKTTYYNDNALTIEKF